MIGIIAVVSIGSSVDKVVNEEHAIEYSVTGDGKANLTFVTDTDASISQETDQALPWTKKITVKGITSGLNISAQNNIGSKGSVSCKITVDGEVVKSATSKGEGAIASCVAP